jgi:hypothetical protein
MRYGSFRLPLTGPLWSDRKIPSSTVRIATSGSMPVDSARFVSGQRELEAD